MNIQLKQVRTGPEVMEHIDSEQEPDCGELFICVAPFILKAWSLTVYGTYVHTEIFHTYIHCNM